MDLSVRYHRRSAISRDSSGLAIALAPNLRRDRVGFRGQLVEPIAFREAIGALHDIVINDQRYKPRDKSAYEAYQESQRQRELQIRRQVYQSKLAELRSDHADPMPEGLEDDYRQMRKQYWRARSKYSRRLLVRDRELWRYLMPCDPVVTVAEDALLFECFSADESSYGCLSVDRDAFRAQSDVTLGTTNVDYTWQLYEHFQTLRSYRETRFEIDPDGFGVTTESAGGHHEEKIDLPNGWLRGFMRLQSAMSMPMRRIKFSREAIYNVLAFLKRNRAKHSPRALRIECSDGKSAQVVLEPWEKSIPLPPQDDESLQNLSIRLWGRDRLHVLSRLLPLMDSAELCVLGTGLPSFWVIRMGAMRLTLGLSGWTTNGWTHSSALSQLTAPVKLSDAMLVSIGTAFNSSPAHTFDSLRQKVSLRPVEIAAGLNRLALLGQVIHDLSTNQYRWRQVMPAPLSMDEIGDDDPETAAAMSLIRSKRIRINRDQSTHEGLRIVDASLDGKEVSLVIDSDGMIRRGSCKCSHHYKNALRLGPCRHLQVIRNYLIDDQSSQSADQWYQRFWN
ncbi:metal-binding protein [Stieleria sp. JC731]|uniref:metal-binding protein n=1 Tax=Pirellulaceae TaxID=2691357 RepID=UPI001E55BC7F|nr:metal-binding protein [Stieleria sp. JC731]MCC9600190.1 metal-binding protein [Stieleria sp. JC731]